MVWSDYIVVLLFVVIVALVVYFGRGQARVLMAGPIGAKPAEAAALRDLIGELKRSNDNAEKLIAAHEARISAIEARLRGGEGPAA